MKQQAEGVMLKERKTAKQMLADQRILLLIVIAAVVIFVGIMNPRFLMVENIVAIFQAVSVTGLLTMTMAMLLLNGGLDLSSGDLLAMVCVIMSVLLRGGTGTTTPTYEYSFEVDINEVNNFQGMELWLVILIGIGIAVGCTFANGVIVAKSKCMPLIITLGLSKVYFGFALVISNGKYLSMDDAFESFRTLKIGDVVPVTILIFIAMVVVTWFIVNRTRYGRQLVAVGGNEEMARLSGINVDKNKIITYTLGGFYIALAGILYATRLNSITATAGGDYALSALSGAIIGGVTFDGGKGTIIGAFIGCMFMGIIENAMNLMGVDAYVKIIVNGAIIVAAVVMSNISNLRKS